MGHRDLLVTLNLSEGAKPTNLGPTYAADATAWVSREISGAADIVWVIGKGDSCDPFTQNDAGRTPASQLLRNYHAQIPAGGDRVRQVFWQVPRQARSQRTSNLSSLLAQR